MDARAIIDKIQTDAQADASRILAEARLKAGKLKAESEARISGARTAEAKRADTDAREMEQRMLRMADLEDRKALLAGKREVMDRMFTLTLRQLETMPAAQARAYFLETLLSFAEGGEMLLPGDENHGWYDEDFLRQANAALLKKGIDNPIMEASENVRGTGFALRRSGAEINCTFGAILAAQRLQMEADAAQILFS
jgi:V/A-type H+/Na+-transporting ATPase subunit E